MVSYLCPGIYAAATQDELSAWGGALLSLDHGKWTHDHRLILPVARQDAPTGDDLRAATAFIHQQRQHDRPVLVFCPPGVPRAAVFALAYLVEYDHMPLPDAYILVSNYAPLKPLPHGWIYAIVQTYELAYTQAVIYDPLLPVTMSVACAGTIHHIDKGIYLSNIAPMTENYRARELGIEAVLRVDNLDRQQKQWPTDFILCDLPIADGRPISPNQLALATAFIHQQVSAERRVLIHCQEGISRSVTMVLAYLIEYGEMTLAEAARLVVRRRPVAEPHPFLTASLVAAYDLPYTVEQVHDWGFFYRLTIH